VTYFLQLGSSWTPLPSFHHVLIMPSNY
jgi:hypothetical protein